MSYRFLSLLVISLALAGCTNTTTASTSSTTQTTSTSATTSYALADVAQHDTKTDCWMAIDSQVYDVTDYVGQHPGGNNILQGCGKDASSLFNGTSMMGRMHSKMAKSLLKTYLIGSVQQ